jgi:hypothetical protein
VHTAATSGFRPASLVFKFAVVINKRLPLFAGWIHRIFCARMTCIPRAPSLLGWKGFIITVQTSAISSGFSRAPWRPKNLTAHLQVPILSWLRPIYPYRHPSNVFWIVSVSGESFAEKSVDCGKTKRLVNFLRAACLLLVPRAGIEPARLAARDFESRASTCSAISATQDDDYDRFERIDQYP